MAPHHQITLLGYFSVVCYGRTIDFAPGSSQVLFLAVYCPGIMTHLRKLTDLNPKSSHAALIFQRRTELPQFSLHSQPWRLSDDARTSQRNESRVNMHMASESRFVYKVASPIFLFALDFWDAWSR
jgi:hypothetical protein